MLELNKSIKMKKKDNLLQQNNVLVSETALAVVKKRHTIRRKIYFFREINLIKHFLVFLD